MGDDYYDDPLDSNFTNLYEYMDPTDATLIRVTDFSAAIIYLLAMTIGIPANIYVLIRMKKFARNDYERYRNGTGVALCSMAAADLCSLLLIFAQNFQQMFISVAANTFVMDFGCKVVLFMTHTVTGISVWSWLLLSCLRYLAIRHPLYHLRLWQMPYRALAFIITTSVVLNLWLLVVVQSSTNDGCTEITLMRNSFAANQFFHLIESIWSFCIPLAVIIVMDISVLLKSTSFTRWKVPKQRRKSALEEIIKLTRSNSVRMRNGHHKALWKWLIIALICITLNAPENIFRIITVFTLSEYEEDATQYSARTLAQALYFSQFAFNAIYLAVFVYDKSSSCKADSHSNAVPLSLRSRHPSTSGLDSPPVSKQLCVRLLHPDPQAVSV